MEENEQLIKMGVFSIKLKPAAASGDMMMAQVTSLLSDDIAHGYKVINAHAISFTGDAESVQVFVCLAKQ